MFAAVKIQVLVMHVCDVILLSSKVELTLSATTDMQEHVLSLLREFLMMTFHV